MNNRSENANEAEISFRVTGKTPELWNPQTGKTEKLSYQIKDGRTIVPLKFESWDAFFIVFKDKAVTTAYTLPPLQKVNYPLSMENGISAFRKIVEHRLPLP